MAGKLASLLIKISADGASAEKELRTLEKKMTNTAKEFEKVGKSLSKYITAPLTALAGVSVAAANTQVQAEAKLLTALKGREDAQQRLIKQAGELQSRTTLGDEAIIEQQAYLAALGLTEKQIGDTIEAAAQLSTALNMDLGSAVKNLAKTYGGMTGELGEGIPALKNLTKEQLQAGEAIKYVNENYKGFAETAAQTGAGSLIQLKNTLGDIAEQFGVILLPALQKITEKLKEFAQWLQNLSPEVKKAAVIVGTLAAAIGPLLVATGKLVNVIKLVALALPALKAGLLATINPIASVVAGVTALAVAWTRARINAKRYRDEALAEARKAGAEERQQQAYDLAMKQYGGLSAADIKKQISEWKEMRDREAAVYISASGGQMTQQQLDALRVYDGTLSALNDILAMREEELRVINQVNQALKVEVGTVEQVKTAIEGIEIPDDFKKLALSDSTNLLSIKPIDMGNTTLAANQMSAFWENLADKARRSHELINNITDLVKSSLDNLAITMAEGLGDALSGLSFDPGKALMEALGKSLKSLGAMLVTYATTMKAFKDALARVFLKPWSAIALGIAAIATGQYFVNKAKEPIKLANGGLAYAPTLAVVGDNRGAASDPEVIAPLSKLRNYMGGQQLELVGGVAFELRGDVARAILDRENIRLKRKG